MQQRLSMKSCTTVCHTKCYQMACLPYLLSCSAGTAIFGLLVWNSVLGESFRVLCGVRQGGVLSPYLFALYTNDLIDDVKKSGYGIYIGSAFLGSLLYADDVLLLSASCTGLQQMVNVCDHFSKTWDIGFNPSKSHCITFGGSY